MQTHEKSILDTKSKGKAAHPMLHCFSNEAYCASVEGLCPRPCCWGTLAPSPHQGLRPQTLLPGGFAPLAPTRVCAPDSAASPPPPDPRCWGTFPTRGSAPKPLVSAPKPLVPQSSKQNYGPARVTPHYIQQMRLVPCIMVWDCHPTPILNISALLHNDVEFNNC